MQVFKALVGVMRELTPIVASHRHPQGWQYRGVDDVYNNLQPLLARHGIVTVPIVQSVERSVVETPRGGQLFHALVTVEYKFCAEDGSSVSCVVAGEGTDALDNAVAKALTDAHCKALVQTFVVPKGNNEEPKTNSTNSNRERLLAVVSELGASKALCKEAIESRYPGKSAAELNDQQINQVISALLIRWAVMQGYKNGDPNQTARSFAEFLERERLTIGDGTDTIVATAWGATVNAWLAQAQKKP